MRPALINAFRKGAEVPLAEVNPFIRSEIKKSKKPKPKAEVLKYTEQKALLKDLKLPGKKERLWISQNGLCAYCDIPFTSALHATLDHIQPKSKGGSNGIKNLALVCKDCNQLKGNFATFEEAMGFSLQRLGFFTRLKERGFIK